MASVLAARVIVISRAGQLSSKHAVLCPIPTRPSLPHAPSKRRTVSLSCVISGVDGGGVSDEFVSTRKSGFSREFSVIASMLKRIEPLDNSVISKGVSDSAKDSMKQTISTMLGLLPSDQFKVIVSFSKEPLDRLIVSSIVTGYTLWNTEYRLSLVRNFSLDSLERSNFAVNDEVRWDKSDGGGDEKRDSNSVEGSEKGLEIMNLQKSGILPSEALNYIKRLESELSAVKQELDARRQENLEMENIRHTNNNLLEYLRSLEPDMVTELSKPSSPEVEEVIHEIAQNTLQRFFKDDDDVSVDCAEELALSSLQKHEEPESEVCDRFGTSRDNLAKLLFWCMLMGHHLRGLENRLHLSCVVGLL